MKWSHLCLFVLLVLCVLLCALALGQLSVSASNVKYYPKLTYATMNGVPLRLDVYLPRHTAAIVPVVLAMHGGGWVAGSRHDLRAYARALAARGYAVVVPEYRLAPHYRYPAQLDDMRQAARWVRGHARQYHFNMARFHLFGFSAGAYLAAMLGVQPGRDMPKVASVICCSGPMDFTAPVPSASAYSAVQVLLGASREKQPALYRDASPITHVSAQSPPFLLVHGTADNFVPFTQSARMAQALQKAKVRCVLHPMIRMDHELPAPETPRGKEILHTMLIFLLQPALRASNE